MASVVSNVEIYAGESDPLNIVHYGVASATTLARGDLVKCATGAVTCVSASSDNTTFAGLSCDVSENGETRDVCVLTRGRCIIGVSSSTYSHHEALTYSAGANGTDWTLAAVSSGADGLFWSLEYKSSAVTSLKVQWDSLIIGASIGSGSGLWEGFAS